MVFVNGEKFNDAEFHNGEVILEGVSTLDEPCTLVDKVKVVFQNNKDITAMYFARMYLKDKHPHKPCELEMLYCPYERMDREINNQMFSLRYFAGIIKGCGFSNVTVLDPHSYVLLQEFWAAGINVKQRDLNVYVNKVVQDFKPDYICYPDKGAAGKYPDVLTDIKLPYFFGNKKRDLANKGKIISTELVNAPDIKGKRVLIIDDICCLGGTAYNVGKELKKAGAESVAFYISHCENGIYVGNILKNEPEDGDMGKDFAGKRVIDVVYTANTMGIPIEGDGFIEVKVDM